MPSTIKQVFVPTLCRPQDGKPSPFHYAGSVTLWRPKYGERKALIAEMGGEDALLSEIEHAITKHQGLDGAPVPEPDPAAKAKDRLEFKSAIKFLIEQLPAYVAEVDIKRLPEHPDGAFHFTTLEQLEVDSDMEFVLVELASQLTVQYRLGKQS